MMSLFLPAESSDRLECGGRCGIPDCTSVFATSKALAQHVKLAKLPQCRYVSVHLYVCICMCWRGRESKEGKEGRRRERREGKERGGKSTVSVCVLRERELKARD